jgi:hypothetical protein
VALLDRATTEALALFAIDHVEHDAGDGHDNQPPF